MNTHSLSSHSWMDGKRLLKSSVILLLCGLPAQAYLGNFESSAGYIPWQGLGVPTANVAGDWQSGSGFIPSPFSFNPGPPARYGRVTPDFTRYNAGQTGAFTDIADNTGLWVAAPGSGGRPQSDASNGVEKFQFVAIHDGATRPVGETNVMCIRTEDAQSTLDYRYTLDSRDLAGIAPGDLTDAIYTFDYVFCPAAGADSSNISMLGFADDALTTALQVGTSGLGNFQYRAGSSGAITTTATMIGFGGWSEVSIVINTATDRASILVKPWDDVTNSLGAPVAIVSNFAVTNLAKITKFNFVQIAHVDKYFYDGFVMSASGGNLSCAGSLVANSSFENGNFSNFTTSDPDINGTLQTFGGSQSVFLSLDPGGNTLPDTPITGFRANTGNWVDASTNGGLGAKDGNRLFVIPPNLGANKCLYPNSSLGFVTQVGTCYRVCVWAAQFDVSSPNNPALESDFNFEFGDINGVDDPGATANYSITPTAIDEAGSWNAITWKLPASTNVKDLNGNLYTGAVGQVVDWRTLNWQRICFDFTPSVTSARLETYMSSTSLNNGIALDGMCVELCDVAGPACDITDVVVTPGACNDNGTPADAADDYYTASVAVTFSDKPATGNLVLSGVALHSANSVTTVAVGSTTSATTHTFAGVKLKANGVANAITATFSADPACTLTINAPTVAECSVADCAPELTIATIGFGPGSAPQGENVTLNGGANVLPENNVAGFLISGSSAGAFYAICTEISQPILPLSNPYSHELNGSANGFTATEAYRIAQVVQASGYTTANGFGAGNNTMLNFVALQMAVWNALYDVDYTVTAGSFQLLTDNNGARAQANTWLAAAQLITNPTVVVYNLHSAAGQDLLMVGNIPGRITNMVCTTATCNDNGTAADGADDYFLSDVTVTFVTKPASGNLVLSGSSLHAGNSVTTVAVGGTTTATTHTFVGVKMKANGTPNDLTATFSAEPLCPFTKITTPVAPCSANCPTFPPVADSITVACNTAVNKQLSTAGGVAPYTYAVTGGALPTGLSLTAGGLLSGDPTVVGTFNVTITVTDVDGCSGVINLEIIVSPCYSLGNLVWNDNGAGGGTLNDGIRNGAEPALANVLVELLDGAGLPYNPGSGAVTTTTNGNGYYRFDNLPAGNYCVRVASSNFAAAAVLDGFISSGGQSTDFTAAGNNKDHGAPVAGAVTSTKVTLGASNPTGEKDAGATGAGDNGPEGDANDNLAVDFGFFVVPPGCLVNDMVITPAVCNDNGTPADATDDYYTASVTVNFTSKPATGDLVLSGAALHSTNSVTTVAVGSTTSATSHTFASVRLKANGVVNTITSTFSADVACTLTVDAPNVPNCSTPPCDITDLAVTPGACNDNGTPENEADDYFTANVSVTFSNKPASGNLVLSGVALHSANSVSTVVVGSTTSATTHNFVGVRLKANGLANAITATFSADPACTMTVNTSVVPECSTPPVECCPQIILGAP